MFEHVGEAAATAIDAALAVAHSTSGAHAPYFVGVKMHDNDFFAAKSAWLTTYVDDSRRAPWNPTLKAELLPEGEQAEMWTLYESAVKHVASLRDRITPVNAPMILKMLESRQAAVPVVQPPAPTPAPISTGPLLYVSGTMHIGNNPQRQPKDVDVFIEFFRRVIATGVKWSIGADIGWLEGEPRAGEVIRATEAMGVEWDVHAHSAADRIRCAAKISALGGHPNTVVSGLTVAEIDSLRAAQSGNGVTWTPAVPYGLVLQTGHGFGSDVNDVGVWQSASSSDYATHGPNGNLIAVGGGPRDLSAVEQLAAAIAQAGEYAPVTSITVMVHPQTLTVAETGEDIAGIEAIAARLATNPVVRWATLSAAAQAWIDAGRPETAAVLRIISMCPPS
ncbi:MAG: hypothetical protein ACT4QE_17905 [Anaerolineales bacterium]